ncbi:NrdR family transcriptional regulator [Campylobacter estrildidarum]|uniref:Transcriptional repressor NrdR-like N-terminal domain-containing protein n=1 Tax=Campylobacter estrildidarum TaxID=2510189 RepID=A0A4U7BHH0_9BACT|nr:hypothetical protein [Campylobacter estrildidarum]TKX29495.1 hypothetical protein CQA69_07280 [Campylobacter estrildidarum]
MFCPRCANDKTRVLKTIKSDINERFRRCVKCGYAFTSIELVKIDKYAEHYIKETQKGLFDEEFYS